MFGVLTRWLDKRRHRRLAVAADARRLLNASRQTAYYDAHRLATRARVAGDGAGFMHWARVAAEIARISYAPMDANLMRAVVEEEERRARRPSP